ncbi:hypothetical protein B7494_g8578 [Chlorociboria aeruginascens]|nr:hypothetical protein B7494_g8578 [Chlorociboria aeruginascens]
MAVLGSFGIGGSPLGAIVFLVSSSVVITLSLAIYRIFYHPLSRFPGPKLAAASRWYEAYYDLCYGMGGQYTAEIRRMHEKYGPIVRIGPNEVSVSDPDFHEVVYAPAPAVRNKIPMIANILGTTAGTFGSMDHYVHRKRRAATSRFFSVDNIAKAEPIIREHVERFCTRLQQGQAAATVWEVRVQFMALKLDIFYDFAFADSLKLQQNPEDALAWDGTMEAIAICAPWVKMFPWILPIAVKLNPTMVHAVWPAVARVLKLNHRIYKQAEISAIDPKGFVDEKKGDQRPAPLFQTLLESNLPDQEKSTWRMSQEGSEMFAASGTTARVMSACMFYLHERPETLKLLQQELDERIPDPRRIPALKTFESFTYMQAVIRESLRMAAPVATRLPLVAPSVIEYGDWCIPAGTPVSVNQRDLLHDPAIYDDPFTFKPERWLATGKDVIPERFFVPFNKGTRMCLGRDFAMAELQTTIAYLIRRFDFQLVDTTREKDVEVVRDCFLSEPRPGSRGVKVRVVDIRK